MRQIKWVLSNPTDLNQLHNDVLTSIIFNNNVHYGFVKCKDYYQELALYLLENKFENKIQYGFKIDATYYQRYQNMAFYEFGFRLTIGGSTIINEEEVISAFNELIELIPDFKDHISYEIAQAIDNDNIVKTPILIIRINSDIIRPLFQLSFILFYFRELVLRMNNATKDSNLNLDKLFMPAMKWIYSHKNDYEEFLKTFEHNLVEFHNYSGILGFFNFLKKKYKWEYVIVYGTLKKGFSNHGLLQDAVFIKSDYKALTGKDDYGDTKYASIYNLGFFPGLKFDSEQSQEIDYEVYLVSPETLSKLDRLEGYKADDPTTGLYNRQLLSIGVKAHIYTFNKTINKSLLIKNGKFNA